MENLAVLPTWLNSKPRIAVHDEATHQQKYFGAYGLDIYRFMKGVQVEN
jgi:hypothetical protein